jgi:hypothetical protein
MSDAKEQKHVNARAAMIASTSSRAAQPFQPSKLWTAPSTQLRGSKKWQYSTPVSEAIKQGLHLMMLVRETLSSNPLYRDNFTETTDAIDRYWLDRRPELLDEVDGTTAEDVLWLAISHLFHVDKRESPVVAKIYGDTDKLAEKICEPYTSAREYAFAVLKSELKYRLATFHSGKQIFVSIQKPPPPPPPDQRKLLVKGAEAKSSSSSSSFSTSPEVREPRLVTPLGTHLGSATDVELLFACSAYAVQSPELDAEFVSLASRLYFAAMLHRLLLEIVPVQSQLPDEVLEAVADLKLYLAVSCQSSVEHMGTLFREYLTELYLPACCFTRSRTISGKEASTNLQTVSKFMTTVKELMPSQYSLDGLISHISVCSDMPPKEIMKDEKSQLYDDFVLFFFAFMFEAQTGLSFREYLVVTEYVYSRLQRIGSRLYSEIPLRFRRPVIIVYGPSVFVKDESTMYRCRTKCEACCLWAYLTVSRYDGKLENDKVVTKACAFILRQINRRKRSHSSNANS